MFAVRWCHRVTSAVKEAMPSSMIFEYVFGVGWTILLNHCSALFARLELGMILGADHIGHMRAAHLSGRMAPDVSSTQFEDISKFCIQPRAHLFPIAFFR